MAALLRNKTLLCVAVLFFFLAAGAIALQHSHDIGEDNYHCKFCRLLQNPLTIAAVFAAFVWALFRHVAHHPQEKIHLKQIFLSCLKDRSPPSIV